MQELDAILARRRQIVAMLTAERNRLEGALPSLRPGIQEHIAWLEDALKRAPRPLVSEADFEQLFNAASSPH